jgi:uncharacterized protein (TIGR02444 family)
VSSTQNPHRHDPDDAHPSPSEPPADRSDDDALWRFSLRIYRAPGVASACLALQDQHRVDVNLLLCLLWRAALRDPINAERLARLESAVQGWRTQLVVPLRALRRELKQRPALDSTGVPALRDKIKALELEAEHLQQQVLARLAIDTAAQASAGGLEQDPGALARLHLRHYETMLGCRFGDALLHPLLQALAQAGPGFPETSG